MVDFALVGGLLTLLFVAVLQFGLVLHVRNSLLDCAAEGARYGARADRTPAEGVERARELVASELSPRYATALSSVSASEVDVSGILVVEVRMTGPLPVIGLVGPRDQLTVRGHAFAELQ